MTVIMDENQIRKAVLRIAQAICDDLAEPKNLFIVGIHTGGVHLAKRLQEEIRRLRDVKVPCGTLDITLYRDDLFDGLSKPIVGTTVLPDSIEGREVVLVDDVLYTGRTVRSALQELMDYGRPKRIRLAVLVDRGHRELPVTADFVGETFQTSRDETVQVNLCEVAEKDQVLLVPRPS